MVANQNQSNLNPQAQEPDRRSLFDVCVVVRNHQGNQLFKYYPKAGVIELKRNKVFAQITVAALLESGTAAIVEAEGGALVVSLPKVPEPARVSVGSKVLAIDE